MIDLEDLQVVHQYGYWSIKQTNVIITHLPNELVKVLTPQPTQSSKASLLLPDPPTSIGLCN